MPIEIDILNDEDLVLLPSLFKQALIWWCDLLNQRVVDEDSDGGHSPSAAFAAFPCGAIHVEEEHMWSRIGSPTLYTIPIDITPTSEERQPKKVVGPHPRNGYL